LHSFWLVNRLLLWVFAIYFSLISCVVGGLIASTAFRSADRNDRPERGLPLIDLKAMTRSRAHRSWRPESYCFLTYSTRHWLGGRPNLVRNVLLKCDRSLKPQL